MGFNSVFKGLIVHKTVSCYTICTQTNSRQQLFLLHRWTVLSHTFLWLGMFRTKGMKMNAENEDAVLRPIDWGESSKPV